MFDLARSDYACGRRVSTVISRCAPQSLGARRGGLLASGANSHGDVIRAWIAKVSRSTFRCAFVFVVNPCVEHPALDSVDAFRAIVSPEAGEMTPVVSAIAFG